jgi:hypothetical protein
MSMILGFLMYSSPVVIFTFLLRRRKRVDKRLFRARFGTLIEGLKTEQKMHILFNFFFTLRRVLLIVSTVFLSEHQAFQVMSYIFLCQLNVMYLIHYKPYEDLSTNYNEIFNELCVLSVGYQLFIFTDFVDSIPIKEKVGLGLITSILVNFGVNLLLQLFASLRKIPRLI